MNIIQVAHLSYEIRAGGPGSGRHPGFGHGEMKKAVKSLNQRGWLVHNRPKGYSLTHPDLPGHTIRLKNNGEGGMTWHHWAGRITHDSGTNAHSLTQHVDSWMNRHEAVKNQSPMGRAVSQLKQLGNNELIRTLFSPEVLDKVDDIMPALEGLKPLLNYLGIHAEEDSSGNWQIQCK